MQLYIDSTLTIVYDREKQIIVVGIFADNKAVVSTFDALLQAGFQEDQLGFVARTPKEHEIHAQHYIKHGYDARAVARGVLGGLLGAADILLVPFIGPTDASNVLATALPVTEEALDHLSYPGSNDDKDKASLQRPDDAMRAAEHAPLTGETVSQHAAESVYTTQAAANAAEDRLKNEELESTVTGGVVGGALGAAAAALLLPGIGFIVAGGIIAAALGGGAVGGVAGNFLGTMTEMGVPHEDAQRYEKEIKSGRTIVTVRTPLQQQEAEDILRQQGAIGVQRY
jgi:hypothetical protein